jgi:very-short-patch-repair endonuclease
MKHHPPPAAIQRARGLRKEMTDAERKLWRMLKEHFHDWHFRKQVPLRHFIADFASHRAKLVIEIDGGQHAEADAYDAARTRTIESEGYRVLRFWNHDVLQNTDGVVETIQRCLSRREREGAAKRRKGEGDKEKGKPASNSPSPSQPSAGPLPLPMGEEL